MVADVAGTSPEGRDRVPPMTMLTRFFSGALIAVLLLTGGAMAVARGQTDSASLAVICTGQGPVMIALGPDGEPVAPPHYCPDGALALLAAVALPVPEVRRIEGMQALVPVLVTTRDAGRSVVTPQARGPPGRVI